MDKLIVLDIGGALRSWTLTKAGKAASPGAVISLRVKRARQNKGAGAAVFPGNVVFSARFTGELLQAWADEGVSDTDLDSQPLTLKVRLTIDDQAWESALQVSYSSQASKGARLR